VASSFPSVKDLTLETREMNMDGCLLADDGEADEESASQVPGQTSEQMEERLLARVHIQEEYSTCPGVPSSPQTVQKIVGSNLARV
jgi:hypothetical protein